jgi:serine/threonine protein kinase
MAMENPFKNPHTEQQRDSVPPSSEKPSSSRRLRELSQTPEHLRAEDVRREIEERLQDLMQPANKIGSGQVADVYSGRDEDGLSGFCIKHKARNTIETVLDCPLQEEMRLQEQAYRILEKARGQGKSVARIPQPWAYVKTAEGAEILSMDLVPGKTLRRLLLERAAHHMPEQHILPGYRSENLEAALDDDLEKMVMDNFLNANKKKNTAQLHRELVELAGNPPFLTKELALQVRNTLQTLHAAGFFHRDIHAKNIMISDDLTQASLIDFGRASFGEHTSMSEAVDVDRAGTKVQYLRDEGILSTISSLIPKPAKKA